MPALRWQPLIDAAGAILHIRRNAEQFGTDPAKIAICGFSAGGHLAASAATMLPEEVRPAFAVLIYPVITAAPGKCHKGSFDHLLGTDRTAGDEAQWSLQNRVTASTPPTLLLLADDDRRQAMRKAMRDVAVIDSADRIYRILLELAETRRA